MSIFLDTGVLVAFENRRDENHTTAREILGGAAAGDLGAVYTSDYVFDEAVTLALARTRRPETAARVGELVLGTGPLGRIMGLAYVTPRLFLRAWARFGRLAARGLSFTDCTSLEIMQSLGMSEVASFDADFEGLVPRCSGRSE